MPWQERDVQQLVSAVLQVSLGARAVQARTGVAPELEPRGSPAP